MDNGRLADVGSHSELIKTSEIYKDIYESQLKGNEQNGAEQTGTDE